jgi:hypothetical protein
MARRLQPFEKDTYAIVSTVNELSDGRSNNVGQVKLTPGATSTAVAFATASISSMIELSPLTPNAAAVPWYILSKLNGSFVIGHPSSAFTDLDFDFSCVGG